MLEVYDQDLIYSWTPREFRNKIKGAKLRQIDEYEFMSIQACAHAQAQNSKKHIKPKNLFDKQKAIRMLEKGDKWQHAKQKDLSNIERLQKSLKGFTPNFKPKKGGKR